MAAVNQRQGSDVWSLSLNNNNLLSQTHVFERCSFPYFEGDLLRCLMYCVTQTRHVESHTELEITLISDLPQSQCSHAGFYSNWNFCDMLQITEANVHHKNKVKGIVIVLVWRVEHLYIWLEVRLSLQLSPYLGVTLEGAVRATVVRGRLVFQDGSFCPEPLGKHLLIPHQA